MCSSDLDEELRELYESRQKWQRDYSTSIALAKEEGREEGKIEEIGRASCRERV